MALIIPDLWNSAHRPVIYRFTFPSLAFTSAEVSGVNTKLIHIPAIIIGAVVGGRVYIPSGLYAGNHIIVELNINYLAINTTFIGTDTGTIKSLTNQSLTLWAGYPSDHEGYPDHPYRLIASFEGIPGLEGELEMDVSGYLKSLFKTISAPRLGRDLRMSVPFDLRTIPDIPGTTRYVLNGTFKQDTLQGFDNDYKILNARAPIIFQDGVNVYSMIWPDTSVHGEHIFNIVGSEGEGNMGGVGFDEIGSTFIVG